MTNVVAETMTRSFVRRRLFPANLGDLVLPAFIVAYSAIAYVLEPRFLSWDNLDNLASQLAPLVVMSVGQAFTIISGGLDLSMAAVMSISGIAGILSVKYVGVWAGSLSWRSSELLPALSRASSSPISAPRRLSSP